MRKLALLIAAGAVAISMSGCSMIPGLGSQTGVQACAAVSNEVSQAMTNFQTAASGAASDPDAAMKALAQLGTDLKAARGKVTNADVGAALDKAIAGVEKMSALMQKGGDAMSSDEFTAAATDVQTAFTDLAKACTKI
jgi:hypothetical protein